jgi:hypothetical protein
MQLFQKYLHFGTTFLFAPNWVFLKILSFCIFIFFESDVACIHAACHFTYAPKHTRNNGILR